MVHDVGACVVSRDALAILLYTLFNLAESQCQETDPTCQSWFRWSRYHFACDLASFTN